MKHMQTQKGFTLVELAIVMTIIGLLIGGILKGQELMNNARLTATIAQVRSYEAATTTFRDKYDSMPGDMVNASTRIPGCTTACDPLGTILTDAVPGDGIVGVETWSEAGGWATQTTTTAGGNETMLFWTHLLLSDLIAGVTDSHLNTGTPAVGETHPSAKIGGSFVAGWGSGGVPPGRPTPEDEAVVGPTGSILVLTQGPATSLGAAGGGQPLTPTRAAQIDRKMDDGRAIGGYVQAYGLAASCFNGATQTYAENVTSNDCGLIFRIQG